MISLYSAQGQLVRKVRFSSGTDNVDISGLPGGIYTLRFSTGVKKILLNN